MVENLLIIHNKYLNFGGEDSNYTLEVENLSKNYNVIEFSIINSVKITLKDIINIFQLSNRRVNKEIKRLIIANNIQHVYVHNTWYKINLGIFKLLNTLNINVILKIHNFRFDCIESNHFRNGKVCHDCSIENRLPGIKNRCYKQSFFKSLLITRYSKKYFKIIKAMPLKIFVFSSFHKNYLISLGVDEEKIRIQPNFIRIEKKENKYNQESDYATLIGRIEKGKGIEALIEQFLDSQYKKLTLFVLGDGELRLSLEKKFKNYNNIKFLGQISTTNVNLLLKNAKFNLFGSLMYEGQPMVLMEASTLFIPTIVPLNGGIKEYFPPEYKLFFEINNLKSLKNLLDLINDNLLLESSRQLSEFISKNYSYKSMIEKFKKNI